MLNLSDQELIRPAKFYERRSTELRIAADESAERYSRYTKILGLLVLLGCWAFYESVAAKRLPLWAAFLVVPAAAFVVQQRHRCHLKSVQLSSIIQYYETGTARLTRKWDLLDGGEEFDDEKHLYSRDLDLFGHGSLYQLLCSARTCVAHETLARWMKAPAQTDEIRARQEAISELRRERDLPESIAAAGPMRASDFRPEFFKEWVAESSSWFPVWAAPLAFVLALVITIPPILYWTGVLSSQSFWTDFCALLFVEAVFATIFRSHVKAVLDSLATLSIELPTMLELLQIMERHQFSSAKLKVLTSRLARDRPAASARVRRLLYLARLAQYRDKEWFGYPSLCLLWGTQFAMAIERWRRRHEEHFPPRHWG